jgi:hypothetical protein
MLEQYPYISQARALLRKVWYSGSDAVTKGYGLCYNRDYGTATDADGLRDRHVALPDNTNNNSFAGVAAHSYAAVSGGQWIEICEPGSVCEIYVDASVTIGDNLFTTCQIGGGGSGTFEVTYLGFMGKGTARIMQTRTGAGLVLAELMTGPESGLIETLALTTASTGATPAMKGGVTVYTTGGANLAGDVTDTLANGTYLGMKKRFFCVTAPGANDIVITVTAGEQLDGATDLATMELDGTGDDSLLEWGGTKWRLMHNAGTGLA